MLSFHLCISGWGFGWRTYLALALLCVPVIVQPMVEQAYHDLLPYNELALSYDISDLEQLPAMLQQVSAERICSLRRNALRYRRLLMWDPPGLAYDMLQISLCRRALTIHGKLNHLQEQYMQRLKECAKITPEQLLDFG